jgi:hypothetical protein
MGILGNEERHVSGPLRQVQGGFSEMWQRHNRDDPAKSKLGNVAAVLAVLTVSAVLINTAPAGRHKKAYDNLTERTEPVRKLIIQNNTTTAPTTFESAAKDKDNTVFRPIPEPKAEYPSIDDDAASYATDPEGP